MEVKTSPGKINRKSEIAEESNRALFCRRSIQSGEKKT